MLVQVIIFIAIVTFACYQLLWGIFTAFMFIETLKHNKATQVVFWGSSAIYNSVAQIVNNEYGKTVLPL